MLSSPVLAALGLAAMSSSLRAAPAPQPTRTRGGGGGGAVPLASPLFTSASNGAHVQTARRVGDRSRPLSPRPHRTANATAAAAVSDAAADAPLPVIGTGLPPPVFRSDSYFAAEDASDGGEGALSSRFNVYSAEASSSSLQSPRRPASARGAAVVLPPGPATRQRSRSDGKSPPSRQGAVVVAMPSPLGDALHVPSAAPRSAGPAPLSVRRHHRRHSLGSPPAPSASPLQPFAGRVRLQASPPAGDDGGGASAGSRLADPVAALEQLAFKVDSLRGACERRLGSEGFARALAILEEASAAAAAATAAPLPSPSSSSSGGRSSQAARRRLLRLSRAEASLAASVGPVMMARLECLLGLSATHAALKAKLMPPQPQSRPSSPRPLPPVAKGEPAAARVPGGAAPRMLADASGDGGEDGDAALLADDAHAPPPPPPLFARDAAWTPEPPGLHEEAGGAGAWVPGGIFTTAGAGGAPGEGGLEGSGGDAGGACRSGAGGGNATSSTAELILEAAHAAGRALAAIDGVYEGMSRSLPGPRR